MAIVRTVIVDDDGSLTTGTIFNNAWKTELYDQIDAVGVPAGVAVGQVFISSGVGLPGVWSTSLTLSGGLNVSGNIFGSGDVSMAAASFLFWTGRASLNSIANGKLNVTNNAATVGAGLDVTTDSVLQVRTRAQTGDAAVKAAFYNSSTSSVLTITTNTIVPTGSVHHVGAGLIKTITVPALLVATGSITIIPDAAFTYDATGNIVVPAGGGTAVVNKAMTFTWDGTKWTPSY
jgi:hypothetical protein